jgi:ornithine cyclodeaminase/alanine dehydrogenase-like protein (mu-crystallin family)
MSELLDIGVRVAQSLEEAAGGDVLVTTTPSIEPLIRSSMLHPGLHITAVGSDAETKQEIDSAAVIAADRFVCDSITQSLRLGELRAAVAAGFSQQDAVELGDVISGGTPGRTGDDEITICDLTGTGAQDTAIASLAVERCSKAGLGTAIDT